MKNNILVNLLFAAGSLMGCSSDALLESDLSEYFVINGDTVRPRNDPQFIYRNPNYFIVGDTTVPVITWTLKKEPLNLRNVEILKKGIEDNELINNKLRLVSIGGGPVSGIRNGGYNNENLGTSFPNIVANQLGIEFSIPYFEAEDGNGYGTLVPTNFNPTGGALQKFKVVNNNLAIEILNEKSKPILKPLKQEKKIDHFGVQIFPGFVQYSDYLSPESINYDPSFRRLYEHSKSKTNNYKDIILNEKFHIILDASLMSQYTSNLMIMGANIPFENGIEGYKDERSDCKSPNCQPTFSDRINFLIELSKRKGIKGVLYTRIPTHILPFTQTFKVVDVKRQLNIYQKGYLLPENAMIVYSHPSVDSLMGSNVNMNLKPYINQNLKESHKYKTIPYYPYTELESGLELYRKEAHSLSKQLNWAVVDITAIYTDVINERYISPDGYRISIRQFFSEDGYSPSLIGQVVLANETIKAINAFYKTDIPLADTRFFLKFSNPLK